MRLTRSCSIALLLLGLASTARAEHDQSPAAHRARALAASHPRELAADGTERFVARDVLVDADGTEHVRLDREWRGLRVVGGDTVLHARHGAFLGAEHGLPAPLRLSTRARLDAGEAVRIAGAAFPFQPDGTSTAELVVLARGASPRLAWEVVVGGERADGTPSEWHVFVDAHSGRVLEQWDGIQVTAGSGTGFFVGPVGLETTPITGGFSLKDPLRGNNYTVDMLNKKTGGTLFTDVDNRWGDGTLTSRQTIGVDAQFGVAVTWDYFKLVHGRNGIANNGVGAYNRVHYGRSYNNAFWSDSCFCMTYGDGDGVTFNPFTSLDVAGHEMTHGVTSRTAALVYSGESGGLSEATSDIFGTMVEYYAGNAYDVPDYLIGEELYKSGTGALRYMYRPSLDGRSPDCWSSTLASLDVHYSSGPANHFFYLLAEGTAPAGLPASATCNGTSLGGIGRAKAERVWYRALTVYMTSSTNYAGARVATLRAAGDLYGLSSAEYAAVAAAWSGVSVD